MPKGNYKSQTLPTDLLEKVENIIEDNDDFENRADFIKKAIKEKIERYKDMKEIEEKAKDVELTEKERKFFQEIIKRVEKNK